MARRLYYSQYSGEELDLIIQKAEHIYIQSAEPEEATNMGLWFDTIEKNIKIKENNEWFLLSGGIPEISLSDLGGTYGSEDK